MVNGTHGLFAGIAVANLLAGIMAYLYAVVLRRQTLASSLPV
jgi:hypothetical protein